MQSSFVIGKIAGIEIGIHYSWLFAFVVITVFLGMSVYPSSYPHWADATHWVVGAGMTIVRRSLFAGETVVMVSGGPGTASVLRSGSGPELRERRSPI